MNGKDFLMNYHKSVLRKQYARMSLPQVIMEREDCAFGPCEYYERGTDPERETRLTVLTEVLFEKMTGKKTSVQTQAQTA